ncbi:MAG: DUF4384 domain-containing protein [Pseudomonadota bacterium]
MLRIFMTIIFMLLMPINIYAAQSTITESEGYACMGDDKSRKETEQAAMTDAKKRAIEFMSTYIKTESQVKNFQLEKDLVSAYSNATVKVIQEIEKNWYKDAAAGDCYKIKIKAEVIPDENAMNRISKTKELTDNPSAPLVVNLWTDKKEYINGEKIKIYIKGNKPFYAFVLYKDVKGTLLQLLPNPYREENYFNGGVIYEIPSGNDRFELEVSPPFGEENVFVYASTSPLGDIDISDAGVVYEVKTKHDDIGAKTRGIKLVKKSDLQKTSASEFFEDKAILRTGR